MGKLAVPLLWRIGLVRGRLLFGTHRNQEPAIEGYLLARGYQVVEVEDNPDGSIHQTVYQHPVTGAIVDMPYWGGYISATRAARHVFNDVLQRGSWD